jgi:hypothetical protein
MRSVGHRFHVGNTEPTPSLEESMSGGGFASFGFMDETPDDFEPDAPYSPAEEAELEAMECEYRRRHRYTLSDPAADLTMIVAGLPDECLMALIDHPDVCGANAERVLDIASAEVLRRGPLTAA